MKKYQDHFFLKAKKENYPARSIYKLKEINQKYKIFKSGQKVLDLGAAPGSWSMGALEIIGNKGVLVACDLKECSIPQADNVFYFQDDIFAPSAEFNEALQRFNSFNVIMSDMAPATTGSRITDQARSMALAERAFELTGAYLETSGHFIVKIFMGPDTDELLQQMRKVFKTVKIFKPKSSRSESKETFFIGLEKYDPLC